MALAYLGRSSTFKRCLALLSLETAFTTSEVLQVGSRVKRKCPLKLACNSLLVDARALPYGNILPNVVNCQP